MQAWADGPSPFDRTGQITCPIIGFFGLEDTNPSPADRIDAEMTRLGKPHEFHRYAGPATPS
jgi:carboxymethylenebutenolidase